MNRVLIFAGGLVGLAVVVAAIIFLSNGSATDEIGGEIGEYESTSESAIGVRRERAGILPGEDDVAPGSGLRADTDDFADETRHVLVLDEFGDAVEGASVSYYSVSEDGDRRRRGFSFFGGQGDEEDKPLRKYITDERGLAQFVATVSGQVRIDARGQSTFGRLDYNVDRVEKDLPEGVEAIVTVLPIKELEVAVVNEAGVPVPYIQVSVFGTDAARAWGRGGGRDRGRDGGRENGRGRGRDGGRESGRDRGRDGGRGRGGWGGRGSSRLSEWTSDKEGLVRFELKSDGGSLYETKSLTVRASLPGLDNVEQEVEIAEMGLTRTSLQIPATIAIDLSILDHEGERFLPSTDVTWILNVGEVDMGNMREVFGRSPFGRRRVADGHVILGGFSPDAIVNFSADVKGRMPASTSANLRGVGAVYKAELVLGKPRPSIKGRLVYENNQPMARSRLTFELETGQVAEPVDPGETNWMARMGRRMMNDTTLRTDEEGRFEVEAQPDTSGKLLIFSLEDGMRRRFSSMGNVFRGFGGRGDRGDRGGRGDRGDQERSRDNRRRGGDQRGENRDRSDTSNDVTPMATAQFDTLKAGEPHDVGDLKVDRGPILVAGKVVNEKGDPVEDVRMRVRTESLAEETRDRGRGGRGNSRMDFMRGRSRRGSATSEEDGAFTVYGSPETDVSYRIEVSSRDYVAEPVLFSPGQKDVVVSVVRPGGFRGSLVYTDERIAVNPEVRVRDASHPVDDRGGWRPTRVNSSGEFRFEGLMPGTYNILVRLDGMEAAKVDGIQVSSGDPASPEAVHDILVGQGFELAEVNVSDALGAPLERARVYFGIRRDEGNGRSRTRESSERTDKEGRVEKLVRAGTVESVRVRADAHADARISTPSFPLNVSLIRGATITVAFDGEFPTLENVRGYRVMLYATDVDPAADYWTRRRSERSSRNLDPSKGTVEFSNITPGTYLVGLEPRRSRRGRSSRGSTSRPPLMFGNLSVRGGGGQPVTVTYPITATQLSSAFEIKSEEGGDQ